MKYNIQTMAKKIQASHEPLQTPPEHTWLGAADPYYCYPSRPHLFSRVTLQKESHIGLLTATVTYRKANMHEPSLVTERAAFRSLRARLKTIARASACLLANALRL